MRKNSTGKAILRFLIGAVLLAAVIVVLLRFVLPNDQTAPLKEVDNTRTAAVEPTNAPEESLSDVSENDSVLPEKATSITTETEESEDSEPGMFDLFTDEPEDSPVDSSSEDENAGSDIAEVENLTEAEGLNDDEPLFGEVEEEPEDEPEDEPEIEHVVTPVPVVTPAPIASADCNSAVAAAQKHPWKSDRATRIKNGITQFETLTSDKGGSVIKITGWSYGNWEGFNGKNNTTFVSVTNEKNETKYYDVTVVPGVSGITHTIKHGRNMEHADFTCMIDVSDYPDGTYSLGSANRFKVDGNTYSFAYTYGEAYTITVVSGIVTARGGVEN